MDITYLGHSSFKLKGREKTLITDPYDPTMVGLKSPKETADIVTISHHHPDHDFVSNVSGAKIVDGAGEYEIGGVSIVGISSFHDNSGGSERGRNTIYLIEMDGVKILHLGDLGHTLSREVVTDVGSVDIVFIPVGGHFTIGPKEALEVVSALSPKIIIPMHYKLPGMKEMFDVLADVDEFVNLMGGKAEKMSKLTVKEDVGNREEQLVVVLSQK